MKKVKSESHKKAKQQLAKIVATSNEHNFHQNLQTALSTVLTQFVSVLRKANRGSLVNNFDSLTLSMPLEYSLINNYWVIQVMKQHLRSIEKR